MECSKCLEAWMTVVHVLLFLGVLILDVIWVVHGFEEVGAYVFYERLSSRAKKVVLLAILAGVLQILGVKIGVLYAEAIALRVFGLLVYSAGIALAIRGKMTLGRNWDPKTESRPLITWGAYHLCRHPIYLGGFLAAVGAEIALGSILVLLAIPGLFVLRAAAISEEEMLLGHFGEEYRDYQRRVKRFIVI